MQAEKIRMGKTIEVTPTTTTVQQQNHSDFDLAVLDEDLLGISEEELDKQCDELFSDTPIKFRPRKNDVIDEMIAVYIRELGINIPIVWIKGSLYLIGSHRLNCELKGDQLILRVGGGYNTFEEWVVHNQRYFQRMLVIYMIKSGESLEWVVDQLIAGRKIKNIHQEAKNQAQQDSKFRKSPSRQNSQHRIVGNQVVRQSTPPRMHSFRESKQLVRVP